MPNEKPKSDSAPAVTSVPDQSNVVIIPPEAIQKAAEQGAGPAEYALGACYADGIGLPQDLVEAYKWIALAASHGQKNAATFNETLAKKLSADQKSKAQQLVQAALGAAKN